MNTNDTVKILKENGSKYTDKRKDVLDIFVEEDKYINAKYIQQVVDENYPGVSFDIVHRNLHLFKDLGIIEDTEPDGEMKFRIACANHHHHHFICEKCGDTEAIDYYPIDQIKLSLPSVNIHKHKLEACGVCEPCQD